MSQINKLVRAANWRYAIAELALIVAGVSIALFATSWYDNRQERIEEREILAQLKQALTADLELVTSNFDDLNQSQVEIDQLISAIEARSPFTNKIEQQLRAVVRWRGLTLRTAPYEALKNRGLELVSDTGLRTRIVELYEYEYPRIFGPNENDRAFSNDAVAPYLRRNFLQDDEMGWTPHDWESVLDDPYFLNLMRGKKLRLQNFLLPRYADATVTIEGIIDVL